jgi:hypothetical protein
MDDSAYKSFGAMRNSRPVPLPLTARAMQHDLERHGSTLVDQEGGEGDD